MSATAHWPGSPWPWRSPWQPGPPRPPQVPFPPSLPEPGDDGGWLAQRLFDRRVLLLGGDLDADRATATAAQLLTLDAGGREPIDVRLDCPDGDLDAALLLLDALDAVSAPVHVLVTGQAGGPALALLAAGDRRQAYPHARIRLADPRLPGAAGTARELAAHLAMQQDRLAVLHARLAGRTRRSAAEVERDLRERRYLSAAEAEQYGLLDPA